MKKVILFASLAAAAVVVSSCASAPKDKPDAMKKAVAKFEVIEHKASSIGGDIPEWVTTYIYDGNAGVESIARYKDKYVFIGEDSGTNLNALRMWAQGFNVAQDLARLVSMRVQAKFAGAMAGSPDDEVGRYFENVVKNVADATITGARKETDFWIYKRYFKEDGKTQDRIVYDYYVLTTIDKELLKKQLDMAISGVKPERPLTKEQTTAVDRVKEAFYEGF